MKQAATFIAGILSASLAFAGERGATPGDFDFYVLALSWSPSYCAAEGADANPQQCDGDEAYAFVVHGLWPQYEEGYPEFCRFRGPDRVPDRLVRASLDIMPSAGLIGHQWRKHGTCSGLGQDDYFALVRAARERVLVPSAFIAPEAAHTAEPERMETRFIDANPGLDPDGIAVTCGEGYLREVRICMTRELAFRACPEIDEKACRLPEALMPAPRAR